MTSDKLKLSNIKHTYYSIICEAIDLSPEKKMTVGEIYKYLENNYGQYFGTQKNWKNSVRHALSFKKYFIHLKKDNSYNNGVWILAQNFRNELRKNLIVFLTKNYSYIDFKIYN